MARMSITNSHVRKPLLKFPEPVVQGAPRYNDEVRAAAAVVEQVRDKRHALNGLAQTHFVRDAAV